MDLVTDVQDEVFAERKSDLFGVVRLYAPDEPVDDWARAGWLLTTQHGEWKVSRSVGVAVEDHDGPGMRLLIRGDRAGHAFVSPALIMSEDLWEEVEAEAMSL